MNKIWIPLVCAMFFSLPNGIAQAFKLELGAVKTNVKTEQERSSNANGEPTAPDYAQVVFKSDLEGAIWVDGKKYLLEFNKTGQEIPVATSFSYYFVAMDDQFATEEKSKKILPHEIEKSSKLFVDIHPKSKFEAFILQIKEQQQSKQIFDKINRQFIDISLGISMQSHEVTLQQYLQFIKETPKVEKKQTVDASLIIKFKNSKSGIRSIEEYVDWRYNPLGKLIDLNDKNALEHPVVNVSWYEAKAFCQWLSSKDSLYDYRLPYASEWESVAEWNATVPLDQQANFADASLQKKLPNKKVCQEINDHFAFTMPVGKLKKNQKGFYDLLGNVAEWMEDDSKIAGKNRKVHKGGSYFTVNQDGLIKNRQHSYFSTQRHCGIGFRVCRVPKRRL